MRLSSTFFTSAMQIGFLRLQYRTTRFFFYKAVKNATSLRRAPTSHGTWNHR